jgi:small subunit ribosomal protein S1
MFLVKEVDNVSGRVLLSRKLPEDDPWNSARVPDEGEEVNVQILKAASGYLIAQYSENVEVIVPRDEIAWLPSAMPPDNDLVDSQQRVLIIEKCEAEHLLRGSIRRLLEDSWPQLRERYPKGTEVRGTVTGVRSGYVEVLLPGGVPGIVPRAAMEEGGHEFADFERTVVEGQGLDLVVTKHKLKTRRLSLALKRAVDTKV